MIHLKLASTALLGMALVFVAPIASTRSAAAPPPRAVNVAQPLRHTPAVELLTQARIDLRRVQALVRRMKGLAFEATDGTLLPSDRVALDIEFQGLAFELEQLAASSQSHGIPLLDGSTQFVPLQVRPARPLLWNQPLPDNTPMALGLVGEDITTASNAAAAYVACDSALDSVQTALSRVRLGMVVLGL